MYITYRELKNLIEIKMDTLEEEKRNLERTVFRYRQLSSENETNNLDNSIIQQLVDNYSTLDDLKEMLTKELNFNLEKIDLDTELNNLKTVIRLLKDRKLNNELSFKKCFEKEKDLEIEARKLCAKEIRTLKNTIKNINDDYELNDESVKGIKDRNFLQKIFNSKLNKIEERLNNVNKELKKISFYENINLFSNFEDVKNDLDKRQEENDLFMRELRIVKKSVRGIQKKIEKSEQKLFELETKKEKMEKEEYKKNKLLNEVFMKSNWKKDVLSKFNLDEKTIQNMKKKKEILDIIIKNMSSEINSYDNIIHQLFKSKRNLNRVNNSELVKDFDENQFNESLKEVIQGMRNKNSWLNKTENKFRQDDFSMFNTTNLALLWLITSSEQDDINIAGNIFNEHLGELKELNVEGIELLNNIELPDINIQTPIHDIETSLSSCLEDVNYGSYDDSYRGGYGGNNYGSDDYSSRGSDYSSSSSDYSSGSDYSSSSSYD